MVVPGQRKTLNMIEVIHMKRIFAKSTGLKPVKPHNIGENIISIITRKSARML